MFSQNILLLVFTISILCLISEAGFINEQPSVQLMNAVRGVVLMPVVGLGTGGYGNPNETDGEYWGPEQCHNSTIAWLKVGGRRIDTAYGYGSRDGVGTGWVASGVPLSEIFITSEVDPSGYTKALNEFAITLKSLKTDYIDPLLIHWPGAQPGSSGEPIPPCNQGKSTWTDCRLQTWQTLQTLFDQQLVRIFWSF
jgi:diketogulonate reductase-like aldo/keto reductase